ncbi:MAG: glycosyltransferase family 9 protein [Bryobacteraceae bacterium]
MRGRYTEVWAAAANLPLARFANAAYSIASTGLDLLGLPEVAPPPKLIERLRRFDRIVSWYGAARPEFRAAVADFPFEFHAAAPPQDQHAADFYASQVGLTLPAIPRLDIQAPREDFVAIHPFASRADKRWPMGRFRESARRLPAPIEWCAGPEEALDGAIRIDDLYELARYLARARVFLGNDSGITHLAAAVGTPVVALFGPTDARVWAPRGPRVRVLESMECLYPGTVCAAVESIW